MTIAERVRSFLDENDVHYEHSSHEPVYTAQEVAEVEHVPGRQVAKSVILTDGEAFVMAVLPATRKVRVDDLRRAAGNEDLRLATEEEFGGVFSGCEVGAMAPFGNLFDVPVFVDQTLREDQTITFNAGTHSDALTMAYSDFEALVQPVVAAFSEPIAAG